VQSAGSQFGSIFPCRFFLGVFSCEKAKQIRALIPVLIDQGLSDPEIASRMGWTVGTLQVMCSQLKISLTRRAKIVLPQTIFNQLSQRAALMGVPAATLAADLLKVITQDNLFGAVLDKDDTEVTCEIRSVQHASDSCNSLTRTWSY
jgi:hypothetical protein